MTRRSKLVARRKAHEFTQESLANRLRVDASTVRRWENGTNPPAPWHRGPLADALDITLDQLDELLQIAPEPDDAPPEATSRLRTTDDGESDDGVERREFATAAVVATLNLPRAIRNLLRGEGRASISRDRVQAVAAYVEQCRQQDATTGGGALYNVAVALYEQVDAWLSSGVPASDVRQMLEAVHVDLGAQVAWLAFDAGRVDLARRYLQDTMVHARIIDRPVAEVRAMSCMCLVLNRTRRPSDALQCAEAAQRIAGSWATPRVRSLLHLRAAAAHAALGGSSASAIELSKAETELDRGTRDDDPVWTQFITPHELTGVAGRSHQVLGRPQLAALAYQSILGSPDPAFRRNSVFYTVQLAHAFAQQGDVSQAATIALEVLPMVSAMQSGRTRRDLHHLRRSLDDHRVTSPAVYDFAEAYDHA